MGYLCIADISVQCSARNQERVYQTNRTEECLQGFLDERLTLLKARMPCVHAQRAAVRKDCDAMRMRSLVVGIGQPLWEDPPI